MKKEYMKIDIELVRKTVEDKGYYFIRADRLFDNGFVGPRLYIVSDDPDIIYKHHGFAEMAILTVDEFEPIAQAVNEYIGNEDRARHRSQNIISIEKAEAQNNEEFEPLRYELDEAMNTLTEIQRQRVYLYYYKGFTEREIAKISGVSYKQVRKSLDQARKKLRKYFSV